MGLLVWLFSKLQGYLLLGISLISMIMGIYFKGRSDQKSKAEIQDLTNADEIRKAATRARDDVRARNNAGGVRADDGDKRK